MTTPKWRRWAEFRLQVIGQLLATPPGDRGDLKRELEVLAKKTWQHPTANEPTRFAVSTIERWYYRARKESKDTLVSLARRPRADAGRSLIAGPVEDELRKLYRKHPSWSAKLLADNLAAVLRASGEENLPSYQTVRRFLRAKGLAKIPRRSRGEERPGEAEARAKRASHEVRSFEVTHVGSLWHLDFHHGRRAVLTPGGEWRHPIALAVIDDYSRLICHIQWYLTETTRDLVHGFSQALMRRGLPRALMTDNGAAMVAAEFTQGLSRLAILHETTLAYSPHQNGKMECFWGQLEGRLMAMLEGERALSLDLLNRATLSWIEMEYHRAVHSETDKTPSARFLSGPSVMRQAPAVDDLRDAFRVEETRKQRRSDGTLTVDGVRFEVPDRLRHIEHVRVRYARWDLSRVDVVSETTGRNMCPLYPLDKAKNADARRRVRGEVAAAAATVAQAPEDGESGIAPLLAELMADYAATGLPPAYIPQV